MLLMDRCGAAALCSEKFPQVLKVWTWWFRLAVREVMDLTNLSIPTQPLQPKKRKKKKKKSLPCALFKIVLVYSSSEQEDSQ